MWGDDRIELLRNAVLGVVRLALGRSPRRRVTRLEVVPSWPIGLDRQLVRVVNEALHYLYTQRSAAVGLVVRGGRAVLELSLLPVDWTPELEIKAATFHALGTRRRRGRLAAVLTLDV